MPIGYTAYIKDGDITTGKDFLKLCLRNFGVAINMRDEPLSKPVPSQFEPDPYYKKDYEETVEVRNKYRQMTFEEAKKELIEKHKKDIESTRKSLDKYIAEDERYMKVRDEIEKWIPPTSEHENVKKFALNQIDISLNTDIREYCNKELNKDLDISDEAVYSYMNDINEFYEDDVARAYNSYGNIIQEQDRIIQSLLKSQTSNKDMECIVFVPYRGKPVVIKNGEVVSTDNMTSFDVDWAYDRRTEVTVRGE